jgi:hypothetical protein
MYIFSTISCNAYRCVLLTFPTQRGAVVVRCLTNIPRCWCLQDVKFGAANLPAMNFMGGGALFLPTYLVAAAAAAAAAAAVCRTSSLAPPIFPP